MINKLSFSGSVFLCGSTQRTTKNKELKALNKYADKNDCDIVVLNRDYYGGGSGKFSTLLVNEDGKSHINAMTPHFFEFTKIKEGKKTKIHLD